MPSAGAGFSIADCWLTYTCVSQTYVYIHLVRKIQFLLLYKLMQIKKSCAALFGGKLACNPLHHPIPIHYMCTWPHPPRPINDRPKWSTNIIRVTDQIKERKYIHKMMRSLKWRLLRTNFVHFVSCVDNFRITSVAVKSGQKVSKLNKKSSPFVQLVPHWKSKKSWFVSLPNY